MPTYSDSAIPVMLAGRCADVNSPVVTEEGTPGPGSSRWRTSSGGATLCARNRHDHGWVRNGGSLVSILSRAVRSPPESRLSEKVMAVLKGERGRPHRKG